MDPALHDEFRRRFGASAEVVAQAPGRVNLIGEHTDYNEGLVLPCAIDLATVVLARRRDGARLRIHSLEFEAGGEIELSAASPPAGWLAYPAGVAAALQAAGCAVGGCDLLVASEVPTGSGLSSSAALTVALVTALDALFDLGLDERARCRVAHRAECDGVGVPCGLMDPFASGLSRRGHLLRIDCRSEEVRLVPWPANRARLLVAHSGVRRELASGGLAERRRECEEALALARDAGIAAPEATALRDLGPQHLDALRATLPETAFRRVRHVVGENFRVEATCAALAAEDLAAVGGLLRAGMQSLQRDFAVSVPELDTLCEIGDALPGVFGSRLTGAGFGGCTVHLVAADAAADAAGALAARFEERIGRRPPVFTLQPAAGAGLID